MKCIRKKLIVTFISLLVTLLLSSCQGAISDAEFEAYFAKRKKTLESGQKFLKTQAEQKNRTLKLNTPEGPLPPSTPGEELPMEIRVQASSDIIFFAKYSPDGKYMLTGDLSANSTLRLMPS